MLNTSMQHLPQSKLQILPEAGHLAWADQPELFAEMIIDWAETKHKNVRFHLSRARK